MDRWLARRRGRGLRGKLWCWGDVGFKWRGLVGED